MPKSRAEGAGENIRLPHKGRRDFSKGSVAGTVVLEVLLELLAYLESKLDEGPSPERVAFRNMRGRLGAFAIASDTDVAQQLAEEDGEVIDA